MTWLDAWAAIVRAQWRKPRSVPDDERCETEFERLERISKLPR